MRSTSFLRVAVAALLLLGTATTASCSQKNQHAIDCEKLIPAAREQSEKLRTLLLNASTDAAAMEASAKAVDEGAKRVATLDLKEETAVHYAAAYQQQLGDGAKLLRDLGALSPDPLAMAGSGSGLHMREMNFLLDEAKLLTELTDYCR